jgi:trigger factor
MLERIVSQSKIDVPEILIENESNRLLEDLKNKLLQIGLNYEQYLQHWQKTETDLKNELLKEAEERVRGFLVLRQIAKQEKIEVNQEEVAEEVNKSLRHFETIQQAQASVDIEQLKEYTKEVLGNEKTFQFLENS